MTTGAGAEDDRAGSSDGAYDESVPPPLRDETPPADQPDDATVQTDRPGRRRRIVGRVLLGVGVLILLIAGWVGWRTFQAYRHLQAARDVAVELQTQLKSSGISDPNSLVDTAERLRDEVAGAESAVSDPVYRFATVVPWVGENLDALRGITDTVDAVAREAPGSAQLAVGLQQNGLLRDGSIDLAFIRSASAQLISLNDAVQRASATASGIDRRHLIGPIDEVVGEAVAELPTIATFSDGAASLGRVLPGMLGGTEARHYLVVFQNLAEPRATGGIFGSFLLLDVDQGRIKIVSQGAGSRQIDSFNTPITTLPANLEALYTNRLARFPADVNLTPDFPTAASLFAEMYLDTTGSTVDGVIAVDPTLVQVLLTGQAPVQLPDGGQLTADNAVSFLLSDIYRRFPTEADVPARDAYLADATSRAFELLLSGGDNLSADLSDLRSLIEQRRILVWSAREDEQSGLLDSPFSGRLGIDPVSRPSVGVFINDGTGSKLGYYLHGAVRLTDAGCARSGVHDLQLDATVTYVTPPADLPPYVLATVIGAPFRQRDNMLLFAPSGGTVTDILVNGASVPVQYGTDHDREVAAVTLELAPGEQVSLSARIQVADPAAGGEVSPTVVVTPAARSWETAAPPYSACAR